MAYFKNFLKKLSGYLMQAWKLKFTLGQFNNVFILNRENIFYIGLEINTR